MFGRDQGEKYAVTKFALSGLAAVALIGVATFFVMRSIGTTRRPTTRRGGPRGRPRDRRAALDAGAWPGDPRRSRLDGSSAGGSWRPSRAGEDLEPNRAGSSTRTSQRLIGNALPLGGDELASIRAGSVAADVSDLQLPENRFERGHGKLLEVYLPIDSPDGASRCCSRPTSASARVAASGSGHLARVRPGAASVALVLLELVAASRWPPRWQAGFAAAARPRGASSARGRRLGAERRRIAADLHDGVVQDLAGTSYLAGGSRRASRLGRATAPAATRSAEAAGADPPERARAAQPPGRDLPARLQRGGLEAALSDLLAPLAGRGIDDRPRASRPTRALRPRPRRCSSATPRRRPQRGRPRRGRQVEVSVRSEPSTVSLSSPTTARASYPEGRPATGRGPPRPVAAPAIWRDDAGGELEIDSRAGRGDPVRPGGGRRVIRVLLAEDHAVVRAGLDRAAPGAETSSRRARPTDGERGGGAGRRGSARCRPDGPRDAGLDGVEARARSSGGRPEVRVVVLTAFSDRQRILDGARRGGRWLPAQGRRAR